MADSKNQRSPVMDKEQAIPKGKQGVSPVMMDRGEGIPQGKQGVVVKNGNPGFQNETDFNFRYTQGDRGNLGKFCQLVEDLSDRHKGTEETLVNSVSWLKTGRHFNAAGAIGPLQRGLSVWFVGLFKNL
jgi:hypothetical protein